VKYVLYAILIIIAYQFIFKLVIPVFIATRKIKKGFREMNNRMQEEQMGQANNSKGWQDPQNKPPSSQEHAGDYIDYEEVK
jgi:uncharacterized protein YneF (UPF0154 family)